VEKLKWLTLYIVDHIGRTWTCDSFIKWIPGDCIIRITRRIKVIYAE